MDLKTNVTGMSEEALALISKYHWPGNIRELVNVLQRAMLMADMDNCHTITAKQLFFLKFDFANIDAPSSDTLKSLIRDYEKQILAKVLEETNYNKAKTANILDIDLSSLYKKVKQYELTPDNYLDIQFICYWKLITDSLKQAEINTITLHTCTQVFFSLPLYPHKIS